MADLDFPPPSYDEPPAPLASTVTIGSPFVGEADPFRPADGQSRDIVLDAIRAWNRNVLLPWTKNWQSSLTKWLGTTQKWLEGWSDAVATYVVAEVKSSIDYVDAAVQSIINNSITVQRPVVLGVLNDTLINAQNFGIMPGESADVIAQNAVKWPELVAFVNGPSKVKGIYFPGTNDASAYVLPVGAVFTVSVILSGDGRDSSTLKRRSGAIGDLLTFNGAGRIGRSSMLSNIGVDGNRDGYTTLPDGVTRQYSDGDDVVLNCGYPILQNAYLGNSPRNGLRVGKAARAIVTTLTNVLVRDSFERGIWVQQDSTDGTWTNVDVGRTGLSGIVCESASQNWANVHAWGAGVRKDDLDGVGIRMNGAGHILANLQAETCWAAGIHFANNPQHGSSVAGLKSWANGENGLLVDHYAALIVVGGLIYNNGIRNGATAQNQWSATGGVDDAKYAAIQNLASNELTLIGVRTMDRITEVSVTANGSRYMYRAAGVRTQIRPYVEKINAGDSNPSAVVVDACTFMETLPSTSLGANGLWGMVHTPNTIAVPVVNMTNSSTLAVKANQSVVTVMKPVGTAAGTIVNFNSLPTDARVGKRYTLIFGEGEIQIFANGNIQLQPTAFAVSAGRQLVLEYNGTKWVETARL